jgi:hypothetical protein
LYEDFIVVDIVSTETEYESIRSLAGIELRDITTPLPPSIFLGCQWAFLV